MKSFILILLVFSKLSFAQFEVHPVEQAATVKPGEVANALIQTTDESLIVDYNPKALQLLGDADSFFVYSLSPWTKNKEGWALRGKIVFGKNFSPDKVYNFTSNLGSVQFQFKGWLWNPSPEAIPKEFSYEDVPLFSRSWWIKNWPLTLLIFVFVSLAIARLAYIYIRAKRLALDEKTKKIQLRDEILRAQNIQEFALLWIKRDEFKQVFANHETNLRAFYDELNRYQFKPHVSESELAQLSVAKSKLLTALSEEKHGV